MASLLWSACKRNTSLVRHYQGGGKFGYYHFFNWESVSSEFQFLSDVIGRKGKRKKKDVVRLMSGKKKDIWIFLSQALWLILIWSTTVTTNGLWSSEHTSSPQIRQSSNPLAEYTDGHMLIRWQCTNEHTLTVWNMHYFVCLTAYFKSTRNLHTVMCILVSRNISTCAYT